MVKSQFVGDIVEKELFDDLLMIKTVQVRETRAGKPYLAVQFFDRSGEIYAPIWEEVEHYQAVCSAGAIVRVRGVAQRYNNKLQLKVETITPVDEGVIEKKEFIASSQRDAETMEAELRHLVAGVKNRFLRLLLERIFFHSEAGSIFSQSPAAKGIHHAYVGGLLEHSLSMAQVVMLLAQHYQGLDSDLLLCGALLHDIGKIEELKNRSGVIDYTDVGRLKGHLVMGCEMVGRQAEQIKDFPDDLLVHLQHLILSHHGRHDFGSPVVPMTAEALLLSFVDDLDAKMNLVEQLRRKVNSNEPQWSEYQRSLERYLLLRPFDDQVPEALRESEKSNATKQRSLF